MADHKIRVDLHDTNRKSGGGGGGDPSTPDQDPSIFSRAFADSLDKMVKGFISAIEKNLKLDLSAFTKALQNSINSAVLMEAALDGVTGHLEKLGSAILKWFGVVEKTTTGREVEAEFIERGAKAMQDAMEAAMEFDEAMRARYQGRGGQARIGGPTTLEPSRLNPGAPPRVGDRIIGARITSTNFAQTKAAAASSKFAAVMTGAAAATAAAVAVTVAAFAVAALAAKALSKAVDGMTEAAGHFSGELEKARALTEVQRIRDQMEVAREAGPELAGLERDRSDMNSAMRDAFREFIEFISPWLSILVKLITLILRAIQGLLWIINLIQWIVIKLLDINLKILEWLLWWVPVVGPLVKELRKWLKRSLEPELEDVSLGAQQLTGIFNPGNVFGGKKNIPKGTPEGPDFRDIDTNQANF